MIRDVNHPIFSRDEGVEVNSSSILALNAADVFGTQVSEERVMLSVLHQVHGVPRDRIIHSKHKVQHVLLKHIKPIQIHVEHRLLKSF